MCEYDQATWFSREFGFPEGKHTFAGVRDQFTVSKEEDGSVVIESKANQKVYCIGIFETPSVEELRERLHGYPPVDDLGGISFQNIGGDAGSLHFDVANSGAVFQAASQFNCLEMTGPSVRPEDGITRYEYDPTQGPACALACPAGTLYRNYFSRDRQQGQGYGNQIDTTRELGRVIDRHISKLWEMRNGYLLPRSKEALMTITERLQQPAVSSAEATEEEPLEEKVRDRARDALRVGVHWDTPTRRRKKHSAEQRVCQVYCSAVPVSYSRFRQPALWEELACTILDGCYEATLLAAAILARQRKERVKVFLTFVGGGVFGNKERWLHDAIQRAVLLVQNEPLDIFLVHYMSVKPGIFVELESHLIKTLDQPSTQESMEEEAPAKEDEAPAAEENPQD